MEQDRPQPILGVSSRDAISGERALVTEADEVNKSLGMITSDFGMSRAALAESLGLKADTFYLSAADAPKATEDRLQKFLTIMGVIEPWAGGPKQAIDWYRNQPIPSLGNLTAEVLVQQDNGELVRSYLDHYAAGGFT